MSQSGKTAPPAADPKPGRNPGYPETEPRDREDAHSPGHGGKPHPDDGGLDREAENGPEPDKGKR